jgi:signal transduction histidine kinase/DNA-binding response OmpR family regulator
LEGEGNFVVGDPALPPNCKPDQPVSILNDNVGHFSLAKGDAAKVSKLTGQPEVIRVLLVDDDEDDFILCKSLLQEIRGRTFEVSWFTGFEAGLSAMLLNQHDVCLVDYHLGAHNGVELLREALARGCQAPIILLTGAGHHEIDLEAMEAGAADYLVKTGLEAGQIERSMRYALERKRAAAVSAFEQARLVAFGTEIGFVLSQKDSLPEILQRCAQIMVQFLNAEHAQLWFWDRQEKAWKIGGSTFDEEVRGWQSGLMMQELARSEPVLNPEFKDCPFVDRQWLESKGIKACALFPLLMENKLVGAVNLFASQPFPASILSEIGSVANGIALCIERKQAEALVQKLAAFPSVNPDPVLEFDAEGRLLYYNDAAHGLALSFGGRTVEAILPSSFEGIVKECLASGQSKLRQQVVIEKHTLSWSFFPVPSMQTVHCYGSDITEMLNLEAKLRQAQKMESIGQLAAGVAHDFNNILTVIQGYADLLKMQAGDDAAAAEPARQIAVATQRAAGLTRQLLMFSRKQTIQLKMLDVNRVLSGLDKMLPRLLGEEIVLRTNYAPGLLMVEADTGMIEQVVMNLVVNARDAMPKGGLIEIRTQKMDIDQSYAKQVAEARSGKFICLGVTDNGCGMSPEVLSHIFEPFFSTKEVGKGTGLGLATVYGIVQQHGGWVEVKSEENVGTTFHIFLPEAKQPVSMAEVKPNGYSGSVAGRNETILLVEDETLLRSLTKKVLQRHAYRVLEASKGQEAIKVWEENEGKIDLLLTDMVMPEGMNGKELADRLKARAPGLKVIYTSGYCPETVGRELERDALFLQKPYPVDGLTKAIRDCLDGVGLKN